MNKDGDLFDWSAPRRRTRTDQILDAFAKFHAENSEVWALFQRFALNVIASGRANYSANAIFERIRWHTEIETNSAEVKLSNNFRAYYARMFHLAHPNHDGFFRNRKLRSEESDASDTDVQVFNTEPPSEEEAINNRLKDILENPPQEPEEPNA